MNYENADLCAKCGGKCCRQMPGLAHPSDFGEPGTEAWRAEIQRRLATGRWAIDWWEGDPREGIPWDDQLGCAYYIRPATAGNEGEMYDGSWGGSCTFLASAGCELEHDARPFGCRALEPRPDRESCVIHEGGKKHDIVIAWLPWQSVLEPEPVGELA